MLYILINYRYNLLDNLCSFEDLTNSPDIIFNEKISYKQVIKSGNIVDVAFVLNPNSAIFVYDEPLIIFPFKFKYNINIQSFSQTFNNNIFFLASGEKGKDVITFTAPGGYELKNTRCHFSFFI